MLNSSLKLLKLPVIWLFLCVLLSPLTQAEITAEDVHKDIGDICTKILLAMGDSDFEISAIQQSASNLFPDDPLSRSIKISTSGTMGSHMIPFRYVPPRSVYKDQRIRSLPVQTKGKFEIFNGKRKYGGMRIIPNYKLNNIQFVSSRDLAHHQPKTVTFVDAQKKTRHYEYFPYRPHEGAQVILNWSAGHSTINSHAARVFGALEVNNAPRAKLAPNGLLQNVGDNWVDVSALSGDLPIHGTGPFAEKYFTVEGAKEWRKQQFQSLKKFGLPIVAGGRSSECMLVGQVALENPGLLKGMIWLGPTHPVEGFREGLEGYHKVTDEYPPFISPKGLGEVLQSRFELINSPGPKWWTTPDWKTPTLIIVGSEDIEVPESSRKAFRVWAKKFPNLVHYVEIPGSAHDPFSISGVGPDGRDAASKAAKERAKLAWEHVYWFLKKHGLEQSPANLPQDP